MINSYITRKDLTIFFWIKKKVIVQKNKIVYNYLDENYDFYYGKMLIL